MMEGGVVQYRINKSYRMGTECDAVRRVERNLRELDRRFPEYAPYARKKASEFDASTCSR